MKKANGVLKGFMNGLLGNLKDVSNVANYIATVSIEEEKEMLEAVRTEEVVEEVVEEVEENEGGEEMRQLTLFEEVEEVVVSEEVKEEKEMKKELIESAKYAIDAGVPEEEVLTSIEDVDAYFAVAEVEEGWTEEDEKEMIAMIY